MLTAAQTPALRLVHPPIEPEDDRRSPAAEDDHDVLLTITPEHPRGTFAVADDRRTHPRQAVSLRVRGRRMAPTPEARREPFLNLNLLDVSVGGIRAESQTRLELGERVAVYFPPTGGPGRGWDAFGRVVRVEGTAFRPECTVAVAFDMPMAA